jgi:CheY-like chemotaxis protein
LSILLVEDCEDDARLALRAFRKLRLAEKVRWVRNGTEAMQFLIHSGEDQQHGARPKLVLLDLNIPKTSGLRILQTIKSSPKTRNLPVVILTSSNQEKDIAESYRLGANSYVIKPIDFAEFADSIQKISTYWLWINQIPEDS